VFDELARLLSENFAAAPASRRSSAAGAASRPLAGVVVGITSMIGHGTWSAM
jgi:hypothetical protein